MANLKSSKKRVLQNTKRRKKNLYHKTGIKTAIKKVVESLERGDDSIATQTLLRDVEVKLARAKNKNILHPNTAARKISRLALRVNKAAVPA
jgi:small subunit ribosomal protein S20